MKWLLGALGLLLAGVTLTFGIQIGNLRGQLASQQQQIRRDRAQLATVQSAESQMAGQLASLTQPTDPLASYNAVCNMPLTDQSTGMYSTWYFPCTDQAQTIPQPSGP